ncbi:hypothetical protein LPJ56_006535, partial [Coemansia sp. RSA 2599]
ARASMSQFTTSSHWHLRASGLSRMSFPRSSSQSSMQNRCFPSFRGFTATTGRGSWAIS